ncbi:uncharacterized protein LOC132056328 [Lycium ferocissimum]|uniref:uncharacterized protein LOC132056328 n=1 Tax=Lycium ferocissimum TaxID=112874 RepID=UPI00281663EA|nr:uncharacterized protein LOC132056328 [Lycium ferocissimum]
MLCSISTHKSTSNWLDRLRSSKGFSFADNTNLEQFLTNASHSHSPNAQTQLTDHNNNNNNNTGSESSSDPIRPVNEPGNSGDKEELCNVVTNVLSELFCMGESTKLPKLNVKKGSRKQTNPRFCASSEINNAEVVEVVRRKEEIRDSQVKVLEKSDSLNLGEEEEKSNANLMGFSKTEVTVIDTSCAPWKFEKLLFRKKNVWRVRDKKSKSTTNLGKKKKRKADVATNEGEKKQKVISGHDGVCKYSVNEKLQLNDKLEETCRRTSDSVGQASKKKQGNLKLKKASSSVVLIKSIPTSKKNGTSIAKNFLKPSH